jgi:uncharacterized protein (TIGR03435 family)
MPLVGHVCCLCLITSAIWAQPRFEAVSIKPCVNTGARVASVSGTPGRLRVECQSLDALIRDAYLRFANGMPWLRSAVSGMVTPPVPLFAAIQPIKGSAGWVQSEKFTIDAKADSPAGLEMMRGPMMAAVLKDRFKLVIHIEQHEIPVYELAVANGGAKLKTAQSGRCRPFPSPNEGPPPAWKKGDRTPPNICGGFTRNERGGIDVFSVTMTELCQELFGILDRPVIDRTGLTGAYDLHLEVTFADMAPRYATATASNDPSAPAEASDPGGTIASSLSKLGLRLVPAKMGVHTLAIDHVQWPAAN